MKSWGSHVRASIFLLAASAIQGSHASVGLVDIDSANSSPVTVFYPTKGPAKTVERGPFKVEVAPQDPQMAGNGRSIVISPGSTASPWYYFDIAQVLVEAGFVVAMPEHAGDNDRDSSEPGPESWKKRPIEVSQAIDAVARDARFAKMLDFSQVGMYGMSAGGHTALTLAGGRWSPSAFRRHCESHITDDFQTCVGLITRLTGGVLDGLKAAVATWVIRHKFPDENWYGHTDPRITAVVAGVPLAADFDMASLSSLRVPLGLVTVKRDRWLVPKYHSDRVLQSCTTCENIMHLETGGHGALLSPLPPNRSGLLAEIIGDAPDFDRAKVVPKINQAITAFFQRHLIKE